MTRPTPPRPVSPPPKPRPITPPPGPRKLVDLAAAAIWRPMLRAAGLDPYGRRRLSDLA